MNLKQLAIVALLTTLYRPASAQWHLIYTSQEVLPLLEGQSIPDTINPITFIEPRGRLSKKLIVHHAHTKRELVNTSKVWGFTDSKNAIWRYYDGDLCYLVSYNGFWAEYAIYRTRTRQRTSSPDVYYESGYSRTLDGKVEINWKKAMDDVPVELILRKGKK